MLGPTAKLITRSVSLRSLQIYPISAFSIRGNFSIVSHRRSCHFGDEGLKTVDELGP